MLLASLHPEVLERDGCSTTIHKGNLAMNWLIVIALVGTLIWTLLPLDGASERQGEPGDEVEPVVFPDG